jgi:hypothetical protein
MPLPTAAAFADRSDPRQGAANTLHTRTDFLTSWVGVARAGWCRHLIDLTLGKQHLSPVGAGRWPYQHRQPPRCSPP